MFQPLRVTAWHDEDWQFRPSHTLLEGMDSLELVTDDPKLTREYLESLDCEGCRTEFPERPLMLRNGESYVIAERFYGEWLADGDA